MERWFNIQSAISEGDWWGLDLPKSPRYAASARPCGSWVRKCRRTCPCISLRDRSARTTWSARAWKVPTITIIVAIHTFAFQPKTWKNWTNMGLFTKTHEVLDGFWEIQAFKKTAFDYLIADHEIKILLTSPSQTGCSFFPIYLQAAIFRRRRHQEELLPSCDCKAENLGLKVACLSGSN